MAKIALATQDNTKLKHWTQAIKDLEKQLEYLKEHSVPENHACTEITYGQGSEIYYGHVKLLDNLIYDFYAGENNIVWQEALPKTNRYVNLENGVWNDITYHDGLFVAVGSHGRIVTSKNGTDWNEVHFVTISSDGTPPPADIVLYSVKWCGNCFVAVGSKNMFVYSFDGLYWYEPLYVGAKMLSNGASSANTVGDLTNDATFETTDIWYGIAYDELTGIIHLCGTQMKTMACKFSIGEVNRFIFAPTIFAFGSTTKYSNFNDIPLYDIETITKDNKTTIIVCGKNNYVGSSEYGQTMTQSNFSWGNVLRVENGEYVINTDNGVGRNPITTIDWKTISIQELKNEKVFVLLGSNGRSVYSSTGKLDGWNVPTYSTSEVTFDINTTSNYQNLVIVGGNRNSILQYNENTIPQYIDENENAVTLQEEIENIQKDSEQASISSVKHVLTSYSAADNTVDWNGSVYGKEMFFLVGEENNIIYCKISEGIDRYAISLEFYKKYIKILEDRILELESKVIQTNLQYILLEGGAYEYVNIDNTNESNVDIDIDDSDQFKLNNKTYNVNYNNAGEIVSVQTGTSAAIPVANNSFVIGSVTYTISNYFKEYISYQSGSTKLYRTSGKIEFSFLPAPESVYNEMIMYVEALKDTKIKISNAEYENDLYMPDWGRKGFHITMKIIFVGGRVIIQIIDNDQLADNLEE